MQDTHFKEGEKLEKVLRDISIKSVELIDNDFDLMKKGMPNPDRWQKENFKTYDLWLANNFRDRDGERFSLPVLKSFNNTISGKSVLYGHWWGPPGEGTFYKSRLEKLTVDEVLALVGNVPYRKFKQMLEKVQEMDGGLYFLVPTCYFLSSHEDIDKIDAGIIKHVSIGFNAPARMAIRDMNEKLLWAEYQNTDEWEAEALEGSFVFLGAQYGAEAVKKIDPSFLKFVGQLPEDKRKEIFDSPFMKDIQDVRHDSHIKQETRMALIQIKSLGLAKQVSEENIESVIKEIETAVEKKISDLSQDVSDAATAKETVENNLKAFKEALGNENISVEQTKTLKKQAEDYHAEKVQDALKIGKLSGMIEDDKLEERKAMFQKFSIDELNDRITDYLKVFNEKHPNSGQLPDNTDTKNGDEKEPKKEAIDRYMAPVI